MAIIPAPPRRSPFKTAEEMKRIQEADAALQAKAKKPVPEKNEARPLVYFEVGRYIKGPFRGLFVVHQLIEVEVKVDKAGKALAKPKMEHEKKVIADGVDVHVVATALETAVRRRAFK